MTQELQTINNAVYFNPVVFDQMQRIGKMFLESGCFSADCKNLGMVIVKLQAGHELGMQPIEALNSLYIVNGKVTIWGSAVLKRLRDRGYKLKYLESDEKTCTVEVTSPESEVWRETSTFAEAVKCGWTIDYKKELKFSYKHPIDKLRYNAIRKLIKHNCPEVLFGCEMKESAEDYIEVDPSTGEVISEKKNGIKISRSEPKIEEVKIEKPKPKKDEPKIEDVKIEEPKKEEQPEEKNEEKEKLETEAHSQVFNLFAIRNEKDPTGGWVEKTIPLFLEKGLENLFSKKTLKDLNVEELKKYIEIIKREIQK